jgi:hypothetical protein
VTAKGAGVEESRLRACWAQVFHRSGIRARAPPPVELPSAPCAESHEEKQLIRRVAMSKISFAPDFAAAKKPV